MLNCWRERRGESKPAVPLSPRAREEKAAAKRKVQILQVGLRKILEKTVKRGLEANAASK